MEPSPRRGLPANGLLQPACEKFRLKLDAALVGLPLSTRHDCSSLRLEPCLSTQAVGAFAPALSGRAVSARSISGYAGGPIPQGRVEVAAPRPVGSTPPSRVYIAPSRPAVVHCYDSGCSATSPAPSL